MSHTVGKETVCATVEGVLRAAAQKCWGDVICSVEGCTVTEKGIHAVENVFILIVRESESVRSDVALKQDTE